LAKKQFNEAELVNLTVMIGAINLWNRLQIAARAGHPSMLRPEVSAACCRLKFLLLTVEYNGEDWE
jgi:hypothetical protein